jgi:hypothetical protein
MTVSQGFWNVPGGYQPVENGSPALVDGFAFIRMFSPSLCRIKLPDDCCRPSLFQFPFQLSRRSTEAPEYPNHLNGRGFTVNSGRQIPNTSALND